MKRFSILSVLFLSLAAVTCTSCSQDKAESRPYNLPGKRVAQASTPSVYITKAGGNSKKILVKR